MATYRVLVSDPISEKGVEALRTAPGISVDVNTGLKPEELLKIIGDYHGLVVRSQTKVTPEVFAAAERDWPEAFAGWSNETEPEPQPE